MPRDGAERDAVMADEQQETTEQVEDTTGADEEIDAEESVTDTEVEDQTSSDESEVFTRDEFEKLKANIEAEKNKILGAHKKERETRRELERRLKEIERQNEDDTARAQREAEEAALAKYKPIVAENALRAAGAKNEHVDHLIRLTELSALEFDGREVVGLDSEIDRLKEELPLLFVSEAKEDVEPPKPTPKPAPRAVTASRKPPGQEAKNDPANALARALMGK